MHNTKITAHPMIVFWLGVLTGALILGLIFLNRVMSFMDYEAALYKINPKSYNRTIESNPKDIIVPNSKLEKLTPDALGEISPTPQP